ncbi:MAG: hypothetical protein L3J51_05025 [Cocleimonas sp.]|nr:hypothetical protein [Cocleimonas sp.]
MSSVLEDSNHVAGATRGECEIKPELKFYVEFRRHDMYLGEYGFDWMRNDYDAISKDYKKLKSEYTKSTKEPKENKFRYTLTIVEGKEYFVPWLSFLPAVMPSEEKIIKLSLRVYFLENNAEPDDIIRFSSDDTNITFSDPVIELYDRFDDDVYRSLESVTILRKWRKRVLETEEPDWDQLLQMAEECHDELPGGTTLAFLYNLYLVNRETKIRLKTEEIIAETDQQKREKLLEDKRILEQKDPQILKIEILRGITKLIEGGREPVDYYDVQVKCKGVLSRDTLITAYNKKNIPVGYLKVLKNSNYKDFIFEITPIRVLRSRTNIIEGGKEVLVEDDLSAQDKNTIDDKVFGGIDESKYNLQELENHLNKNSLNQALLQCSINSVIDIVIDEEKWIDKGFIIEREDEKFCTGELLDEFKKVFESQYSNLAKKREVVMFLVPLQHYGEEMCAGGYANLHEIDAKELAVFSTNLWSKSTFSHEIAHVIGLEHSFLHHNDMDARKQSMIMDADEIKNIEKDIINEKDEEAWLNSIISEYDDLEKERLGIDEACAARGSILDGEFSRYEQIKARQKQLRSDEAKAEVVRAKESLRALHKHWQETDGYRSYLNRKNYYEGWNPHKFIQAHTENIMDYDNNPISFYKFQWLAMQNDVKNFYSKK